MVMDVASKKVKQLTDGSTYITRNGAFGYVWNPDSKWIALEISPRKHDPYYDIALLNVESGEITNLTNSGYFDEQPVWVLDGNALAFASERYGMRNHASWGSMSDVMLIFMNQDAYDKYRLSEEDYAIRKDLDKKVEKDKDKDKSKSDKKDDKKDADKDKDAKKDKTVKVELDGIQDRVVRVTPRSTDLKDFIMNSDGETLYYLASADKGVELWKLDVRKGDHRMVSKVDGASYFDGDKDLKTMFLFGSSMRKLDPKSDKLTAINYSSTMSLDLAKEREYMFDYVCREEKERFYEVKMHGVDWDMMNKAYRRFLPHINNNYDFTAMLSEMLGELNVSHTGSRYNSPSSTNDDRTGSLGLLFDLNYQGKGLKVDEVIAKGPFDRASSMVGKGKIIEKINGTEIDGANDISTLLLDLVGKKTLVSVYDPESKSRWDEVVIPISDGANNNLLYDRWVKQRAADVDRWSNGRLGYVHIKSMDDGSFRKVYSDVLGKYNDREGIVIDIRWNGGGRLHEDVEVLFSGEKYFTQEIRGTETCDMPSRRWNKPSVMVMCEACYSNAHGTPWVYKHKGLGKLVGMPVPGTMTSVNWVTLQDTSMYFGIPVVGYRLPDGSFLENQQLEPDIKVANRPEEVEAGLDMQLKTAVESLLKDIDSQKSKK
jgi:C-terminal processing protease CtpA/Prc